MRKALLLLALTCSVILHAEVKLPPVFGDNMVLQQKTSAAIWGKAEPNTQITISTTWSKVKVNVFSDENGDWKARLQTPEAGGPYEINITDGKRLTLTNVMIGEVWICMGQSNMDMTMRGFGGQPVEGSAEYMMQADPDIPIRSFRPAKKAALEPQYECPGKWLEHTPYGVASTSAVSYFFARQLYECKEFPVGIINVSLGGSAIEAWMDCETIQREFPGEFSMEPYEKGELPKTPRYTPGLLYNGMLHSVIPFTAKGFIWYQGCSNTKRYEQYKRLQPSFVRMLRDKWDNAQMPFYFTQIAPFEYQNPDDREAAFFMWAQAQTLEKIPYSGMAATHDIGEKVCIHPAKKKQVGDRLAYLALTKDYGEKHFAFDTPVPESFEFKDGKAYVTLKADRFGISPINKDIEGFELAGKDKVFHPAVGRVYHSDYKMVEVSSPNVKEPVAVRYGMRNWSVATMFNNYGIPVSPFRSDNWSVAGYEKHVPVKLTINSETGVYAKGELVEVYASLTHRYTGPLTMRVNLFGQRLTSSNDIKLSMDAPTLIYSGTFDKASSIQVSVGNPKDRGSFKNIGFVVSPEEFTPGFEAPSDLMSFWNRQIAEMRECEMEIKTEEVKHGESEEYICYDLEINMPEGNPVRGYMAMPRNASKASLPIVLLPHAAGVQKPHCKSSVKTAVEWAKKGKGTIALDINAHGMLNGQPQKYYDDLNATTLNEYASRPLISHDEFYFRLMYLRMVRALDYLASLEQWDGRRVLVRGESQGAGQAGALAALDPRVSMSVMIVPALTDLGGVINGDRGGWPSFYSKNVMDSRVSNLSESILPYYDVALLLRHTKAKLVIECGLVDTTCPAECVYSAYNNASSAVDKTMLTFPYRPHHRVEDAYYKDWQLLVDDVRNALIEEHLK